jgi:disulfide bond formation protein DsbB
MMNSWPLLFLAWLVAVVATSGSLFFSEVMYYPPCVLCWYQRIAMYPMVLLLLVPLLSPQQGFLPYVLPLALVGGAIAAFHNLMTWGIVSETLLPCSQGVSCTTPHIEWLGFITIPLLSFTAFTLIIILTLLARRRSP